MIIDGQLIINISWAVPPIFLLYIELCKKQDLKDYLKDSQNRERFKAWEYALKAFPVVCPELLT